MPLILALRRQRQADLCEYKDSMVSRISSSIIGSKATEKSCPKNQTNKQTKTKKMQSIQIVSMTIQLFIYHVI